MKPEPLEIFKLREKGIAIGKEVKVIKLSDLKLRVEWLKESTCKICPRYPTCGMICGGIKLINKAFENVTK